MFGEFYGKVDVFEVGCFDLVVYVFYWYVENCSCYVFFVDLYYVGVGFCWFWVCFDLEWDVVFFGDFIGEVFDFGVDVGVDFVYNWFVVEFWNDFVFVVDLFGEGYVYCYVDFWVYCVVSDVCFF